MSFFLREFETLLDSLLSDACIRSSAASDTLRREGASSARLQCTLLIPFYRKIVTSVSNLSHSSLDLAQDLGLFKASLEAAMSHL